MTLPIPAPSPGSRLNAIKHGLRATDELFLAHLKPEEQANLEELRIAIHEQYSSVTDLERLLADKIALLNFRLFRVYLLEYKTGTASLTSLLGKRSLLDHLDRLSRYDSRIEGQLKILHNRLERAIRQRQLFSTKSITFSE